MKYSAWENEWEKLFSLFHWEKGLSSCEHEITTFYFTILFAFFNLDKALRLFSTQYFMVKRLFSSTAEKKKNDKEEAATEQNLGWV
jgi:hypothetical protein